MKNIHKLISTVFLASLVFSFSAITVSSMLNSTKPKVLAKKTAASCTTIQEGTLLDSSNTLITTSFDNWGYNYQARMFSGDYCDSYRNAAWCQPYKGIDLVMKWNDAWLSNKDCDSDGKLDRHLGDNNYQGSGAWLTNHMSGSYEGSDGKTHSWVEFVKIVAVPDDAVLTNGVWFVGDKELGLEIWGEFAIVEDIYNDPFAESNGKLYLSPSGPGFGKWK